MAQFAVTMKALNGSRTGETFYAYVHSADAKSMKRADLNAATRGAVQKAKRAVTKKTGPVKTTRFSVVECRCVG